MPQNKTSLPSLRIVYAGTPLFAVPALQTLIQSQQHQVVAVYTQPDRRAGRGRKIKFSPVKQLANEHDIAIEQVSSFKSAQAIQTLNDYQADVMIVAAYGLILPQQALDLPTYGCLNIHASLLPRWRGAAPIHRAIEAGDAETGITIMQMAAGLDTGDILYKIHRSILTTDTLQSMHDQLAQDGATALLHVLDLLTQNQLQPEVQNESQACYAHKLTKAEAKIDWQQSAIDIDRKIRAFDVWPTAHTLYKGKPLKFFFSQVLDQKTTAKAGTVLQESKAGIDIATGKGIIRIKILQIAGSKKMSTQAFLNARSLLGENFQS